MDAVGFPNYQLLDMVELLGATSPIPMFGDCTKSNLTISSTNLLLLNECHLSRLIA